MKTLIIILTFISIVVYTYKVDSKALEDLTIEQGLICVVSLFLVWCVCWAVNNIFKGGK